MAPHAAVGARPGPQIRASLACQSCRRRKVKVIYKYIYIYVLGAIALYIVL
jgi:hypothetical protein